MQQKFVRMNELKGIVGLSRSSIYSMVKSDRFPKAKAIGARAKGGAVV